MLVSAALLVLSSLVAACSDAPATGTRSEMTSVTAPPASERSAERPVVSAAAFHARNRMDWAGTMHNQAMDKLREEIRTGKPANVCAVIEKLTQSAEVEAK